MSGVDRLFAVAAETTEPRPGAVDRLLSRQALPARLLQATAREPSSGALDRLLRERRPVRSLRPVIAVGALVLAAIAGIWVLWPAPRLDGRLDADARVDRALTDAVHLGFTGHGEVSGTAHAVHISWEVGTLDVEVQPGAGVALEVETSEGSVAVVGTVFSVTRGPLGTEVAVHRGHVKVDCGSMEHRDLVETGDALCLPLRAAGMLARAQALRAGGAGIDAVLGAVDRGLSLVHPGDPATSELVALRLDVLISAGRYPEARAAAEAYLRTGETARREEVAGILDALKKEP